MKRTWQMNLFFASLVVIYFIAGFMLLRYAWNVWVPLELPVSDVLVLFVIIVVLIPISAVCSEGTIRGLAKWLRSSH
ncbi:hypothetical protein D5F53_18365 [Paenibacillus lautus]|uniref:Uncharacterized protein n=1 Tax=Paenibacillus lautus TaxID=1401 RepID=A0A385TRV4_PAELA|nr:hypothetical protein D5F53_18365 [Paenibacillus lautus]